MKLNGNEGKIERLENWTIGMEYIKKKLMSNYKQ